MTFRGVAVKIWGKDGVGWEERPALFVKKNRIMATSARTEFSSALSAIAKERGLDPSVVLETIRQAIVAAYRRDARDRGEDIDEKNFEAVVDPENGEAQILAWEEGKEEQKEDVTPPGFGRIAAQTAKQVILQKIREAEKDAVLAQYQDRMGSLVSGIVLRFDGPNVRVDLGRAEGIMPASERTPNERLSLNQRVMFLLKEIRETERGREIILSRSDPEIVRKLFAREVPEINSGAVQIKEIAREAGGRTKVAVASTQSGVDPVGSCVGQKGVRVQAVISELNGEKIDVIPWSEDTAKFITAALSPAEGISVSLNEEVKEALVKIPVDQMSLAIGREGQNVRLAAKLTGWKIEIEGTEIETAKEGEKEKLEAKPEEVGERQEEAAQTEQVEDSQGLEAVKEEVGTEAGEKNIESADEDKEKSKQPANEK